MPHPSSQNNGIDPSVAPSNYFTAYFSFTVGPPLSHSRSLPHTIPCINLFVAHHITSTSSCHILGFHFWSSTPPRSIPFLSLSSAIYLKSFFFFFQRIRHVCSMESITVTCRKHRQACAVVVLIVIFFNKQLLVMQYASVTFLIFLLT